MRQQSATATAGLPEHSTNATPASGEF